MVARGRRPHIVHAPENQHLQEYNNMREYTPMSHCLHMCVMVRKVDRCAWVYAYADAQARGCCSGVRLEPGLGVKRVPCTQQRHTHTAVTYVHKDTRGTRVCQTRAYTPGGGPGGAGGAAAHPPPCSCRGAVPAGGRRGTRGVSDGGHTHARAKNTRVCFQALGSAPDSPHAVTSSCSSGRLFRTATCCFTAFLCHFCFIVTLC